MSELDDFMLGFNDASDSTMGTDTMICQGQTFSVVSNLIGKTIDADIGIEPQINGAVTAQPADVTTPKTLLNKRCTVGGVAYRIIGVDVGTVAIHFTLSDPSETR
tara:strand:+ start:698 stop:1012 length:315 start_codon:yes stop_codon:yes gene_type:complete